MIAHDSVELKVPKVITGNMSVRLKNSSIKINNPPAKSKKLKITVNFVGGVHGIYIIKYTYFIDNLH